MAGPPSLFLGLGQQPRRPTALPPRRPATPPRLPQHCPARRSSLASALAARPSLWLPRGSAPTAVEDSGGAARPWPALGLSPHRPAAQENKPASAHACGRRRAPRAVSTPVTPKLVTTWLVATWLVAIWLRACSLSLVVTGFALTTHVIAGGGVRRADVQGRCQEPRDNCHDRQGKCTQECRAIAAI